MLRKVIKYLVAYILLKQLVTFTQKVIATGNKRDMHARFFLLYYSVLWGSVMIYLLFGAGCWFIFAPDLCSFATSASLAKVLK